MAGIALVKTCGLNSVAAAEAAGDCAVDFAGFVFYPDSPRNVVPAQAKALSEHLSPSTKKVAVTVDANDATLSDILSRFPADIIQLHGNESLQRIKEIKDRFSLPVIKAVRVNSAQDMAGVEQFMEIADHLLFDAKVSEGVPGGTGSRFDWSLLKHWRGRPDWFLSGGLDATNVFQALSLTKAPLVDVSSGIESSRGIKDPERLREFVRTVRTFHA